MKNMLFLVAFVFSGFQLVAQNHAVAWFTNFDEAKRAAARENKDILMVFAGSDWCKPCMQFKKDILLSPEFEAWASNRLVVLYLDFPARRKNKLPADQTAHNEALAERFNKSGVFPNIFLLKPDESVLANPKFEGQTPRQFEEMLISHLVAQK